MRFAWRIGRVAGIDIYVHATFLIVFFLFGGGPDAILNLALVLSVFGCVLLHELGHALMARRFGIQTADITLYPIGGVARLARLPRAPGAELLISLAGPAVNFVIAGALALVTTALAVTPVSTSWLGVFLWYLMLVNLGLGAFNLIPAFPMDGGRVLRALLSGYMGRARATSVAARIGQFLAITFGIAAIVVTGSVLHLALAAFIFFAARAEESHVLWEEHRRRRGATVHDGGIWTAPPGYHWVDRGDGVWQLAPMVVRVGDRETSSAPWL
jgi:Zn-dependent protease